MTVFVCLFLHCNFALCSELKDDGDRKGIIFFKKTFWFSYIFMYVLFMLDGCVLPSSCFSTVLMLGVLGRGSVYMAGCDVFRGDRLNVSDWWMGFLFSVSKKYISCF